MHVVVTIKQVPDTWAERKLHEGNWLLDREGVDAVVDEIDTRAIELGLQLTEQHGGEVTVLTMGPDRSAEALRKALAMGAHSALHVLDDRLAGSCAMQTSSVLAAAIQSVAPDVVITGNESTDGRAGAMASMLAERLGWAQVTSVQQLQINDNKISGQRSDAIGSSELSAELPAIVSVTEKVNEPRYPSFKGIMAAKKKPMKVLTLDDLGLNPAQFGLAAASTKVLSAAARPPKAAGELVVDDGRGGTRIVEFLAKERLL
jgi:electron transfer flavoprotein beta subunit